MRLNDNDEHDLGHFESFNVSEDDLETPIEPDSIEGNADEIKSDDGPDWNDGQTQAFSPKARFAFYGIALTLLLLLAINLFASIYQMWQVHWSLGATLLCISVVMIGIAGRAIYHWVKGKDGLDAVHELQVNATELRGRSASFETAVLLKQVSDYYRQTPLERDCDRVVTSLPDYLSDKERLESFERQFLVPLDRKVEKIIQRYSLQTAGAVGFSPLPSLDAIFTLWRGSMMINDIARVYGMKPTFANRLRVLGRVAKTVAYAGLSQGGLDALDLSNLPYVSVGTKVVQGFGAGIAMARVGHYCAQLCRPIPVQDDEQLFGKFLSALKLLIGKQVFMPTNSGES